MYVPEPLVHESRLDDSEQSYILRRLQERTINRSEDIPEIQKYLDSSLAILDGQCPLSWWKVHTTENPTLS